MLRNKFNIVFLSTILFITNLIAQDFSTGVRLIRNEKFNKAKEYFSSQLNSPNKADAYFYLGQINFDEDNLDSAKICFTNGITQNSESALNYAGLVKVNLLQNNLSEVEKDQNKAIQFNDEKDALVYLVLSEGYSNPKVKKYDKSIGFINDALKINSKYEEAYILLGENYLNKGDGSNAIKNFEQALSIENNNPEALSEKANVYILIDNTNDAMNLLNQAINSDSTYSPAYRQMAELYASIKDYSKATEYYKKYITASESTPDRLERYASMLYINKDYTKAINILEELVKTKKDISSPIRILAYSYLRLDDTEKSKYYFEQLFNLKGVDYLPTDYENYADLLSKTGNDSLAIKYLYKVVENDSTRNDVWGKMSVLSFKDKNWDGVISALNKKNTLTTQEYFDLSKAYVFKGDGVITDIMQSLNSKLNLNDEQSGKLRTALLYYQRDLRDAKGDNQKLDAALSKLSQSVESFLAANQKANWSTNKESWLGEVRTRIKQYYAQADSTLGLLEQKSPNLAIVYLWRARANSDFDPESEAGLAKPFYEQFIQLAEKESDKYKKELIEAYSYLGYYYYLQGDNSKSKSYWQQVLSLDPQNKQANDVVKQLK
jgi:tetratricopeptide (TPR) repeat protein